MAEPKVLHPVCAKINWMSVIFVYGVGIWVRLLEAVYLGDLSLT